MCGIIGAIGNHPVGQILVDGLQRLEYRGYDSAGVVTVSSEGLSRIRVVGKVRKLNEAIQKTPLTGCAGLAHTRWATHGKPTENNAHPHVSRDSVAIVHNGIIDNCDDMRASLEADGYEFSSDTDTEVIAHAFHRAFSANQDIPLALRQTCELLTGSYAFGLILAHDPEQLWAACHGSPLVIGVGDNAHYIASDMVALATMTRRYITMQDGDIVAMTRQQYQILNQQNRPVTREIHELDFQEGATSKGNYRHYMLKEIFEQPEVVSASLAGHLTQDSLLASLFPQEAHEMLSTIKRIHIVACGTSYHASLVGRYWFEELAGIPCQAEIASEFRYRKHVVEEGTLLLTFSQSGETADTIAALKHGQQLGYAATVAICNVANSALARMSDYVLLTQAGVEIGVASTKAFTTQLTVLLLMVLGMGQQRGQKDVESILPSLKHLPAAIEQVLGLSEHIKPIAQWLSHFDHALYLGRHVCYPIALEGALKLKEISYIHAEAYPAGELKHGPLALVDERMPIIVLAPNDGLLDKLRANVQEVAARGGHLLVLTDAPACFQGAAHTQVITMPSVVSALIPMLYTIPLQLLSYDVARIRGTDVDQPRNLAKSVTVE